MNRTRKRIAMLIVLVGTALIGERVYSLAEADIDDADKVVVPKRVQRGASTDSEAESASAPPAGLRLDRLEARQTSLADAAAEKRADAERPSLFDAVAWQAPVAKAPPPPPPPKPVPPPFGYAYMGGLTEDGVRTAFFTQGERIIAVKAGDTVDAAFRIDTMTEKQMTLTYLPLNETVVLALGGRP
jgi:hypothetical protein